MTLNLVYPPPGSNAKPRFVYEPDPEPIEPPPVPCDLCGSLRAQWEFGDISTRICQVCRPCRAYNFYSSNWATSQRLTAYSEILVLLKEAINAHR